MTIFVAGPGQIGLETVFTDLHSAVFLFIQLGDTKTFFSIHNNDLWHRKIPDDIKPGNQNPPCTLLCCDSNRLAGREEQEDVL